MHRLHRKPSPINTPSTSLSSHITQNSARYIGNDFEDRTASLGSAVTLTRAMTVTKFNEMLDCIDDLKIYSATVEKDVPDYFDELYLNGKDLKHEKIAANVDAENLIQIAKQCLHDNRYVLLNDLIQQEKSQQEMVRKAKKLSGRPKIRSELHEKQVEYMKHVIAAQPSALEAIYLEALLDPDRWQRDQLLLQSSSNDILTAKQRKRLAEILNKVT